MQRSPDNTRSHEQRRWQLRLAPFERRLCRRNPDLGEAGRSTSKACDDRRRGPSRPPPKLVRRGRLDLPPGFLVRLDRLLEVAVLLAAEEAQAVEPRGGLPCPRPGGGGPGGPP